MGVTGVKFIDYALGGFGMIPGTIVYVFIGTTISNIADAVQGNYESGTLGLVVLIVGSILGLIAIIYISIVVKRYLNKALIEENENKAEEKVEEKN